MGAPIDGDASVGHHFISTKSDTLVHKRRILSSATFPPDKNSPIMRMKRKTRRKKEDCAIHFFSTLQALSPTPSKLDGNLLLTGYTSLVDEYTDL